MPRLLLLLTLIVCLLGQSFASAHALVATPEPGDLAHALLHWQDEAHHHHHDGGVQLDDSDEALAHVMGDHACCSTAPPSSPPQLAALPTEEARPSLLQAQVPAPYLDGLLRPPR